MSLKNKNMESYFPVSLSTIFLLTCIQVFAAGCSTGGSSNDLCLDKDCGDYGECVVTGGRASCLCVAGYIEDQGKCIKNPCSSSPCAHGTCTPDGKNALCKCEPGYSGALCDQCGPGYHVQGLTCVPGSPCRDDPCVYGRCRNVGGVPICECFTGYSGDLCDRCASGYHTENLKCVSDTACDPDPCVHGLCIEQEGSASCKCDPGYSGDYCNQCANGYHEEDLLCVPDMGGPCDPNPCKEQNKTRCKEQGQGGFVCLCDPGFHEENGTCVEDTECSPNPCDEVNKTVCKEDGKGGFVCNCDAGYHEDNNDCVQDTVCSPNPCNEVNKTVCKEDGKGGFVCNCDAGYHEDNNNCVQDTVCNPGTTCSGHGTCTGNGLECSCNSGFTGEHCNTCDAGYHEKNGTCLADTPCDPNPCKIVHKTSCQEVSGKAECDCDPGYQDEDHDGACKPDCENAGLNCGDHGHCEILLGTASCTCDTGYTGTTCSGCDQGFQDNDNNQTCMPDCEHAGLDCRGGSCDDSSGIAACAGQRSCKTVVSYDPAGEKVSSIYIRGEFNGWSLDNPLVLQPDGIFKVELDLQPGDYGYKFYDQGNDRWFEDPANPYFKWVDGNQNSRLRVPDCSLPMLQLVSAPVVQGGNISFKVHYLDGSKGAGLDASRVTARRNGVDLGLSFDPQSMELSVNDKGLAPGKYSYTFKAFDKASRPTQLLFVPLWVEQEHFSWQDAIMYFVLTDRFKDGDPSNDNPTPGVDQKANWQGGDFKGILEEIEDGYFDGLGVNTLWISSVIQNTGNSGLGSDGHLYSGYHSYWPIATGWRDDNPLPGVKPIDPHFGDLNLLKQLVQTAHEHGIRIIVDFVANHVHQDSPLWLEHKDDDPPWFHDLYVCGWDQPINCWFAPYLPDFDYKNLDVLKTVVEHAIWLAQQTNIDGFRLDAVKHMIHDFSFALRARIQESVATTATRFYMVGETFTGEDGAGLIKEYVRPEELDGQFDFPLYWQVVKTFLREEQDFRGLESMLEWDQGYYGSWAIMSNFMGNHDVPRALSHAAGQIADMWGNGAKEQGWSNPPGLPQGDLAFKRLCSAWTFLMSIPGIPLIYYGDEIGMPGAGDPDNRRPMIFGDQLDPRQKATLDHVEKLTAARAAHPALRYGVRQQLYMSGDGLIWSYGLSHGNDWAIVAFNRTDKDQTIDIPVSDMDISGGTRLKDVISGNVSTVSSGKLSINLASRESALLVLE
ncbi:MAG: hypothetical protein GXP49_17355 [Deltaproteobacteria bacterium]|nr:hypothetical protein [Deltaproteobacteria bacterium]